VTIEQQGVLADPAQPGIPAQGLLQHRAAVDEHPIAESANGGLDAVCQVLQTLAHELVIVPPQCIAGDEGAACVGQHGIIRLEVGGAVVHAHADDAYRAGDQALGPRALDAMPAHPAHGPVAAIPEPAQQIRFVLGKRRPGDAKFVKPQFIRPLTDIVAEALHVGGAVHRPSVTIPGR